MFKCEIQNSIRNQSEELPVNMVFRPQKAIIVFIIFCMINTKLCEMCRGDLYLKEQLEKEEGKIEEFAKKCEKFLVKNLCFIKGIDETLEEVF